VRKTNLRRIVTFAIANLPLNRISVYNRINFWLEPLHVCRVNLKRISHLSIYPKKQESRLFQATGYPRTTLISWCVDCNTLLTWCNNSAASPLIQIEFKREQGKMVAGSLGFCKATWIVKWLFLFLSYSIARFFLKLLLCCMQFFSSDKHLQDFFFQNHHPRSPLHSKVKWLAPYIYLTYLFGQRNPLTQLTRLPCLPAKPNSIFCS